MKQTILKLVIIGAFFCTDKLTAQTTAFDMILVSTASCDYTVRVYDNATPFPNLLHTFTLYANTTPDTVKCIPGSPNTITFTNGACSYTVSKNNSPGTTCGTCAPTCPCFIVPSADTFETIWTSTGRSATCPNVTGSPAPELLKVNIN